MLIVLLLACSANTSPIDSGSYDSTTVVEQCVPPEPGLLDTEFYALCGDWLWVHGYKWNTAYRDEVLHSTIVGYGDFLLDFVDHEEEWLLDPPDPAIRLGGTNWVGDSNWLVWDTDSPWQVVVYVNQ